MKIYHISAEGKIAETKTLPALEIQVDFLKSDNAGSWLEKMTIRHIDRVRYVDQALWALAEIREEEG